MLENVKKTWNQLIVSETVTVQKMTVKMRKMMVMVLVLVVFESSILHCNLQPDV